MRKLRLYLSAWTASLLLAAPTVADVADADRANQQQLPPTIAIIIDDMGHNKFEGERLIALDQPLTLAFLPYRRHTVDLAKKSTQAA